MTNDQLKDLLDKVTPGDWGARSSPFEVYNVDHGALSGQLVSGDTMIAEFYDGHFTPDAKLIALAPSLARRVLAAEKLAEALTAMNDYYVDMVHSGDWGNWDPETDEIVIDARKSLAEYEAAK